MPLSGISFTATVAPSVSEVARQVVPIAPWPRTASKRYRPSRSVLFPHTSQGAALVGSPQAAQNTGEPPVVKVPPPCRLRSCQAIDEHPLLPLALDLHAQHVGIALSDPGGQD